METFSEQFERYTGSEQYAKFIATLRGQCRADGRLMYWQEKLISDFFSTKGALAPASLHEVIDLFGVKPLSVDLGHLAADGIQIVRSSVIREFRSINQAASGGSHLTVFEVEISPNPESVVCNVVDGSGPHDDCAMAQELLGAFEKGISFFINEKKTESKCFLGFTVRLLSYVRHNPEFKPSKHQAAIYFLLHDLLSETLTGREVHAKLVGVPL